MTLLYVVILFSLASLIDLTSAGDCPENEVWDNCPKCPEVKCSDLPSERGSNRCEVGPCYTNAGCFCNHGFARSSESGKCIPFNSCHEKDCGKNSHYESCPVCYDVKCEDIDLASFDENKDKIEWNLNVRRYCLKSGCRCDYGYARDPDNNCAKIVGTSPNACESP
ncbi:trypsin inhibitor like cysteine rich domain-containing protein [Ditylenchus destructor]|nr:trypsin inhibitor like cysteine rich domain-containing protein [Ditylenchus destructor]